MTLPRVAPMPSVPTAQGDNRGPYGYGRAAHGSDPQARYQFVPNETILPTTTTERVLHPTAAGNEIEQKREDVDHVPGAV